MPIGFPDPDEHLDLLDAIDMAKATNPVIRRALRFGVTVVSSKFGVHASGHIPGIETMADYERCMRGEMEDDG